MANLVESLSETLLGLCDFFEVLRDSLEASFDWVLESCHGHTDSMGVWFYGEMSVATRHG
jgi:hypothetical protein